MLSEDFGKHLNLNLYKGERNDEPVIQIPIEPKVTPPVIDPVIIQQKPQLTNTPVVIRKARRN
jgi:hypothetical protein